MTSSVGSILKSDSDPFWTHFPDFTPYLIQALGIPATVLIPLLLMFMDPLIYFKLLGVAITYGTMWNGYRLISGIGIDPAISSMFEKL